MTKPINTLTIELPVALDESEAKLMIYAALFGKGVVSAGKAAEYLSLSKATFLSRVGEYGVSVFSET